MKPLFCPAEDQIAGYLLGTLEEEVAFQVAEHLEQCAGCRRKADQLESVCSDALVDSVRQPLESPYLKEPECQRAIARLVESFSSGGGVPNQGAGAVQDSGSDLSQMKEYVLLERLGRGGQGHVYKAFHTVLKRYVVIKMLPPEFLTDPKMVRRFDREMELIGRLNHPHIVRALDARRAENGQRFLVMEYVEGCDVEQILARYCHLRIADACEIARQAALGLQCIYEHGLVHRDIKPANLLLSRQGQVKILDLGLGRFCRDLLQFAPEMTQAGTALGTVDYIAPEQVADSREVDIRADIYSLGCTLYRLLTGQVPFDLPEYKTAWDKLEGHRRRLPKPIRQLRPQIPPQLAEVVHRMLAKNPQDRFATPGEVAEVLQPFTVGANLPLLFEKPASSPEPPPSASRRCDCQLLETPEMVSPSSSVWVWELLGVAVGILILSIGIFWGPSLWEKIKSRWALTESSAPMAQGSSPPSEHSQPQQNPSESLEPPPPHAPASSSTASSGAGTGRIASSAHHPPSPSSAPELTSESASATQYPLGEQSGGEPSKRVSPAGAKSPSTGGESPASSTKESPNTSPISDTPETAAVRIELNRADPVYYGPPAGPDGRGEKIQLTISSTRAGYLYVLAQQPDGQILCLFPNCHQPDNQIGPHQPVMIPDASGSYELRASPPYGEVVLWAWLSAEKLKPTLFGVASLTEHLFTEVDREAVSRLQAKIRQNQQFSGYTERKIYTRTGLSRSPSPLPPSDLPSDSPVQKENLPESAPSRPAQLRPTVLADFAPSLEFPPKCAWQTLLSRHRKEENFGWFVARPVVWICTLLSATPYISPYRGFDVGLFGIPLPVECSNPL
ncbi:MAG: protein kinase [Thermoguttaceae bacterium]|nr:protein kinase [Thermoguttaceae bacterium]MDW8038279.1 protein kinase [Thermoguttaceae bacterium]